MTAPLATCTVVIPCYNAEPYLEAAVESVLTQSFQDFHLVLVDDASRDGTRALARRLVQDRANMTLVELPENRGRSFARNRGTEAASGPFVAFLDQDDAYEPDFLRHTVGVLSQHPGLDAVKVVPKISIEIDPVRHRAVTGSLVTTMLIRRKAFEFVGGWPEGMPFRAHPGGCEDIAFLRLFGSYFTTALLPLELYNYRHRPGNALDQFLFRSRVVDGRLVFDEAKEEDLCVAEETQRLAARLRTRVRELLVERDGQPFSRLE